MDSALNFLATAAAEKRLSPSAVENIRKWLAEPAYAEFREEIERHLRQGLWDELEAAFWTVIPFGTGGRRGRMYPIGCNAINDRTIGESAAGLAMYVKRQALSPSPSPKGGGEKSDERKGSGVFFGPRSSCTPTALAEKDSRPLGVSSGSGEMSCALAYDTRHRSREFMELCARIMVAAGFRVYFLNGYRSTPALSFTVRRKQCDCGIMVTASHNPPSDNAVKVYWLGGGQVLPPHDKGIIDCVMNEVGEIDLGATFDEAVVAGVAVDCTAEIDAAFADNVLAQSASGPRDLKILYTPLHGVGRDTVVPILQRDGFMDVEVFGPHAEPDGDFPHVPGHVSNPENVAVFDAPIEHAKMIGAEIVMATDPDCDRLGVAGPVSYEEDAAWQVFTGQQIGAILADFVLASRQAAGSLTPASYIVKTLVTTEMIRRIADVYGARTLGNLLVGFKWIGGQIDEAGEDDFVFGAEESHGYQAGTYVRDKDGAVAVMLMAELAAKLKAEGKTLKEHLDSLYRKVGYHAERLITQYLHGAAGMARMQALMKAFRESPPRQLAGLNVTRIRDYHHNQILETLEDGVTTTGPLNGPTGDMVILETEMEGTYLAARPSGTEPKVKFYLFTFVPPPQCDDLVAVAAACEERLDAMERDLQVFADSVAS